MGIRTYSHEPPNIRYKTIATSPPKINETKYPSTFQLSRPMSKPADRAETSDEAIDAQVMSLIWFKPLATFAKYALKADEAK